MGVKVQKVGGLFNLNLEKFKKGIEHFKDSDKNLRNRNYKGDRYKELIIDAGPQTVNKKNPCASFDKDSENYYYHSKEEYRKKVDYPKSFPLGAKVSSEVDNEKQITSLGELKT